MKKLIVYFWSALLGLLLLAGCNDSNPTGPDPSEASSVKKFVWNAMNEWYYWRTDVPDLADDRFPGEEAFQQYLANYADGEALFQDLRYRPQEVDRYSFFIDNYEDYEQEQNGIYAALGLSYGFIQISGGDIIGYVQYVVDGSPADNAGLQRGDIFTEVDGQPITSSNFTTILRPESSHTLTMAEIEGNTIVETGDPITVQSERVEEDPVYLTSVIDTSGTQIGYLMYNDFHTNSHQSLNTVFGNFQSAGVDELVLDLRYNGGGSVITSRLLASMASGVDSSKAFAHFTYNSKKSQFNHTEYFLEEVPIEDEEGEIYNDQGQFINTIPMNMLSPDRLYVLTSQSTASASEALVNGLKPYMDVILIGSQTEGKDVGSITLYDAPPNYSTKDNINPNHKKAIQPIVVGITNTNGEGYPDGFTPKYNIREVDYLDNLPPLGSPEDPLLGKAIALITGQAKAKIRTQPVPSVLQEARYLTGSKELRPYRNNMYLEPGNPGIPDF